MLYNKQVQEKYRNTRLERYNPLSSSEIRQKIRESFLEKYGADHPSRIPEVKYRAIESQKRVSLTNILARGGNYVKTKKRRTHKLDKSVWQRPGVPLQAQFGKTEPYSKNRYVEVEKDYRALHYGFRLMTKG